MPLKKQIGEMFSELGAIRGNSKTARKQRAELLKQFDESGGPQGLFTLRVLLKQALDPRLKYALPEGIPPYKPMRVPVGYGMTDLYHETKRLFYFLEPNCGGHAGLNPNKRQQIFIQTLEALQDLDADVLIAVKEKDLSKFGVDKELVDSVMPELLAAPVLDRPSVIPPADQPTPQTVLY